MNLQGNAKKATITEEVNKKRDASLKARDVDAPIQAGTTSPNRSPGKTRRLNSPAAPIEAGITPVDRSPGKTRRLNSPDAPIQAGTTSPNRSPGKTCHLNFPDAPIEAGATSPNQPPSERPCLNSPDALVSPAEALGGVSISSPVQPVSAVNKKRREGLRKRETLKRLYNFQFRVLNDYDPKAIGSYQQMVDKLNAIETEDPPRTGQLGVFIAATTFQSLLFLKITGTPNQLQSIPSRVDLIGTTLGLPLALISGQYLLRLDELAYDDKGAHEDTPAPKDVGSKNGVSVSKVKYSFGDWYVTLTQLDQALGILDKNEFWLRGQVSTVSAVLADSVPLFCYRCYAPGHMVNKCPSDEPRRCGKCAEVGRHDTRNCEITDVKMFTCCNCGMRGHAAFHQICRHPPSVAEWKRASDARKMLPAWAHAWAKQRSNAAQQNPGPASTQKQDEAAKPGKKKRGRPRKNAAAQPENAAVPGAMDLDTQPQHVDHPMGGMDQGEKEVDQCNTPKKRAPGRPKNPPKLDASQTSLDGFCKPRNSQA
ncbi:uncharacterized protein G6M90_00g005630 [Metarhizium brunneum]|uniref:CCHC-type domain-containing protein n=1 Tax=Metarhizium brunneum TaxID=500148 RepID=A0A7D5US47_9HYPO|nr:hypothetical protein G6M90_00g005630 [Metarhizium brunneum]